MKHKYGLIKNIYFHIGVFVVCLFAIIASFFIFLTPPKSFGDGLEYMAQAEAIVNHASTDIRKEDYVSSEESYGSEWAVKIYNWLSSERHRYITESGKQYAPHFGGYALATIPAKLLLRVLSLNELRAFSITNLILYVIILIIVLKTSTLTHKKRLLLILLLIINPAIFYILWNHTEIFSYSFVILGLLCFYERKHKSSIFFISIAAMQNVALIFLGMAIGLDFCRVIVQKSVIKNKNGNIEKLKTFKQLFKYYTFEFMQAGSCYIPCFLPIIHTWLNFKKLNLVASIAREEKYLVEKAWAYWTDLNIGLLPYLPIIVILFLYLMLVNVKKNISFTLFHLVALGGIFYVLSNQQQINSDMAGMMRYNVWITPILIFAIMYSNNKINNFKLYQGCINCSLLMTAIILCWAVGLPNRIALYSRLDFAPWTKTVLQYMPSIYNPYHGIFISRSVGIEKYETDSPVIYKDSEGYVRKILVHEKQMPKYIIHANEPDKQWIQKQMDSLKDKEYQYISIPYARKLDLYLLLDVFDAKTYDASNRSYNIHGVYKKENDFCWIQPCASFLMNRESLENGLRIEYVFEQIVKKYNSDSCKLDVFIDGKLVETVQLDKVATGSVQQIVVSSSYFKERSETECLVELKTNAVFVPKDEGLSNDYRKLSLKLKYLGGISPD